MMVIVMSIAITSRYPLYQFHFYLVTDTINYPTADPRVPVPSIIPVTVDTARELPLSASYFPKSAEHAEDIILFKPLIQKPRMNITMKKIAVGISFAVKVIV